MREDIHARSKIYLRHAQTTLAAQEPIPNAKYHDISPLLPIDTLLVRLLALLGGDVAFFLALQGGEIKRLALATRQLLPGATVLGNRWPVSPGQQADPRLDIPAQLKLNIGPVGQLSRDVGDLIFWALLLKMKLARRVQRLLVELSLGALGLSRGLRIRVDVVVLVPRR